MGSNSKAKKHALEANRQRSGWGDPFMLIGDLYAQTSRSCGQNTGNITNDEFSKRVGYWAAIEKYQYAKQIDLLLTEEANQKIKKYSEQAPDKTSTFQIIGLDQNEYKRRQSPIGVRISKKGFGRDRRYPITSSWTR